MFGVAGMIPEINRRINAFIIKFIRKFATKA